MQRRAKIGATLGPACDDPATLTRLVEAGLDVARLNFSHGDAADHRRRVARLRRVMRATGRSVALMADLQGPRLRVGTLPGGSVELEAGESVTLVAGQGESAAGTLPVTYAALARDVRRGNRILIDDGKIELRVDRVRGTSVRCTIVRGGPVSDRKGINLPGVRLSTPSLTPKDREDLRLAAALRADWLAVSFVSRAEDVVRARRLLARAGRQIPIMAKIELPEAVERLETILEAADGLLVARGDLGVELPPEEVPIVQKRMVEMGIAAGKPVMTATQMLDSMRGSSRPTRAEASDVANTVLDGSDCLLLTAETAAGSYPVEAVEMMARIIESAEKSGRSPRRAFPDERGALSVPAATCLSGCRAAYESGARAIAVFTQGGFSARQVARFRPRTPILAFAAVEDVARQLNMLWGVEPRKVSSYRSVEAMVRGVDRVLLREKLAGRGEIVVVLAGSPIGITGTTNLMELHRVGAPVRSGTGRKKAD